MLSTIKDNYLCQIDDTAYGLGIWFVFNFATQINNLKNRCARWDRTGLINMKKCLLLALVFSCLLVVPQQIKAQSYEDYYNAGYILGASIRKAVDNKRAREAEQQRREQERLEAERAYELEQQRIANERYAIQQREAEARRAEEERLRIANEAKKAEEERLRLEREALSARQHENSAKEYREYNSNVQILNSGDFVKFLTDDGDAIYLSVDENRDIERRYRVGIDEYGNEFTVPQDPIKGGCTLFCTNTSDREVSLTCNRVTIKVKYVGDSAEQTITDACSIVIPAGAYNSLKWSDVFFNLSDNDIESIKVRFLDTQIKSY